MNEELQSFQDGACQNCSTETLKQIYGHQKVQNPFKRKIGAQDLSCI